MLHRAVATAVAATLVAGALVVAAPASAYWASGGAGAASVTSGTLSPPTLVSAVADQAGSATISWSPSAGALEPEGYFVESTGEDGSAVEGTRPACGSSPGNLLQATGCVDSGLDAGTYTYRVTAVFRSWSAASASSAPATIVTLVLGTASPFSVLGSAVTSTGFSRVSGDLGVSPGSAVVGFPDGVVDGDIHAGDAVAASAHEAFELSFAELMGRPSTALLSGDLIGVELAPGVYYAGAALGLTGVLTLDGGGDTNSVFVIQVDAAVSTAAGSSVVLTNGADASRVFWTVDAAVTTGGASVFAGSILSTGAITLGAGTLLVGRALSRDAVTMASATIRFTTELPPSLAIAGGETAVTKDTTPTVSGTTTAAPGRVVTISLGAHQFTATVQPDSTWSAIAPELLAGSYAIVARVKDAAGNGATDAQHLVVEVNPPTVSLGLAETFSLLAGGTIVSTGASSVEGDAGVSPGTSVTGLPAESVGGELHAGDLAAADALAATFAAIDDAAARLGHTEFAGDVVGQTFHAGVHHTSEAFALTGSMTLDGEGDPGAVFIFQVDAAMNTAAASTVLLTNGAHPSRVFWVVDAAVGTGALSSLPGTILATRTITLGAGTQLTGRALTLGSIVMDSTTVSRPTDD